MTEPDLNVTVRRVSDSVGVIDIAGEVTAAADGKLAPAYEEASSGDARAVVLNFSGLEYMNSSGIGLLVTLLIRANRQKQRLLAYGLTDHYREIFELTRIDEAISIFEDEASAVASVET